MNKSKLSWVVVSLLSALLTAQMAAAETRIQCQNEDQKVKREHMLQTIHATVTKDKQLKDIEVIRASNGMLENHAARGVLVGFVPDSSLLHTISRFDITGEQTGETMESSYFLSIPLDSVAKPEPFAGYLEIYFGYGTHGWWNLKMKCERVADSGTADLN